MEQENDKKDEQLEKQIERQLARNRQEFHRDSSERMMKESNQTSKGHKESTSGDRGNRRTLHQPPPGH